MVLAYLRALRGKVVAAPVEEMSAAKAADMPA